MAQDLDACPESYWPNPSLAHTSLQVRPADSWKVATPIGCGEVAGLIHGRVHDEIITLNHEGLWGGGSDTALPDMRSALPEVRRLMDVQKYDEAESHYLNRFNGSSKSAARVACFVPGPDVILKRVATHGFANYKRLLNPLTGLAEVGWNEKSGHVRRRYAAFGGVIGVELSESDQKCAHFLELRPHDFRDAVRQNGSRFEVPHRVECWCDGGAVLMTVELENLGSYVAVAIVCSDECYVGEAGEHIVFTPRSQASIFCAVEPFIPGQGQSPISQASSLVSKLRKLAEPFGIFAHRAALRQIALTKRLRISLGDTAALAGSGRQDLVANSNECLLLKAASGVLNKTLTVRMFEFGRHLLAAGSGEGRLPVNLQGKWNGDYDPPWRCAYFNNENLQMCYWLAAPCGMERALLAIFDLYEERLPDFRKNAKMLFGCRGILLPLYMDPYDGRQKEAQPQAVFWTGAGAWLSQLYWDYYLFTDDHEFLRLRAIPFMKEVAEFYMDFLVEGPAGTMIVYPGNSPENRAEPNRPSVCINPTSEIALIKECFSHLLAGMKIAGDCGETEKLKRTLDRLPQYEIAPCGSFREWLHPDFLENHGHRHLSQIYPFFPGHEFSPWHGGPLVEAVRTSVRERMRVGQGYQTGWSLIHLAHVFARLGDAPDALSCLTKFAQTCVGPNLFSYHNDNLGSGVTMELPWGHGTPMQLEAAMGFTSAVLEMLAYSDNVSITLMPAVPAYWANGAVEGLKTRCGVDLSLDWSLEDGSAHVLIRANRKTDLLVRFGVRGDGHEFPVSLESGKVAVIKCRIRRRGDQICVIEASVANDHEYHKYSSAAVS